MKNKVFTVFTFLVLILGLFYVIKQNQEPAPLKISAFTPPKQALTIEPQHAQENKLPEANTEQALPILPAPTSTAVKPPAVVVQAPDATSKPAPAEQQPESPSTFNAVTFPKTEPQYTLHRLQAKDIMPNGPILTFSATVHELSKTAVTTQDNFKRPLSGTNSYGE